MYALPALTVTAAEVVRDQFATSGSPEPAPEPAVRLARVRAVLADVLDRASGGRGRPAATPPRALIARAGARPRLAAWRG